MALVQIFCVGPKIYLYIVPVTNILCQTKRWFAFSKIGFCASTKVFEEALKCSQIFGLAQNIWTSTKHFEPCKSHYLAKWTVQFIFHIVFSVPAWCHISLAIVGDHKPLAVFEDRLFEGQLDQIWMPQLQFSSHRYVQ